VGYTVADADELEAVPPTGIPRRARRALGVRAFGINLFVFPPHTEGRAHDHAEAGQEEVYFVVRGSGTMIVDGEEIALRPGRFLRVDPESRRMPVSGPDGLEWVVVGAPLEGPYEPPPWG
jgi:mannose-6-phosphate isomerase-like protein (cupin superfamily)